MNGCLRSTLLKRDTESPPSCCRLFFLHAFLFYAIQWVFQPSKFQGDLLVAGAVGSRGGPEPPLRQLSVELIRG